MPPLAVSLEARLAQLEIKRFRVGDTFNLDDALQRIRNDLHGGQLEVFDDLTTREIGVPAGYGAGKTIAMCAKAVQLAALNQGFTIAAMEPTGPQLADIWFPKFDAFLEKYGIPYTFYVSRKGTGLPEHVLHLPKGDTRIVARSIENWRRIVGPDWAAALLDESDTIKESIIRLAYDKILGRIRVGNVSQIISFSTPEGFAWHYKTFGTQEAKKDPSKRKIKMRTVDNPHNPASYIQSLKERYTGPMLKAYMDGEYVNLTTGQVYDRFNREHHVRPLPPLRNRFGRPYEGTPGLPHPHETIICGMDFNVGNCNAVLAVRRGRELWVFDVVAKAHDTDAMGQEIRKRFPDARILGYPDASGKRGSTNSSRSDIDILEGYNISNMAPAANPPVRDRVAAVQAALLNGLGETRLWITPDCQPLIECLELQSYTEKGEPDKESGYDHLNDALGYPIHRLFEIGKPRAGKAVGGIRLY